ncbi:hypothetical protein RRG08_022070 [Elysia crispata]|uniref:Uncharacterized protein n=1 Tax=Elysia crispata TaxID=231223 RepID=A0AAE1CR78_9GAST|nr:hypothetical protein RRG08_022070 [Elysia crispata]
MSRPVQEELGRFNKSPRLESELSLLESRLMECSEQSLNCHCLKPFKRALYLQLDSAVPDDLGQIRHLPRGSAAASRLCEARSGKPTRARPDELQWRDAMSPQQQQTSARGGEPVRRGVKVIRTLAEPVHAIDIPVAATFLVPVHLVGAGSRRGGQGRDPKQAGVKGVHHGVRQGGGDLPAGSQAQKVIMA